MSSWGSVDISELRDLQRRMQELEYPEEIYVSVLKDLAAKALTRVKKRSPVQTGNLRKNWQVGTVEKVGNEYRITIFNDTSYASYVEYGHRTRNHKGWVKGRHMLTLSISEVQRQSKAIIERKLKKELERMMGG